MTDDEENVEVVIGKTITAHWGRCPYTNDWILVTEDGWIVARTAESPFLTVKR